MGKVKGERWFIMKKQARPIGRLENGVFILDEQKHRDFFKKITNESFKIELQNWFESQIKEYCEKKKDGYFLIYLKRGSKRGISLRLSFDVEKYGDKDGDICLPISDLW